MPLNALADIKFDAGPDALMRYDRQREGVVAADLVGGGALSVATKAVKDLVVMKQLPPGVTVSDGGDAELQAELFSGFGAAMRNGLMMVYIVLAVLFASLLHPLTVIFSLPLSIAGAVVALLLASLPITTPVVIGILMLMGIVTKNAIMLVDFAVEMMHTGVDRKSAIIEASSKARPTDRDDDHCDGCGHGAERISLGCRRRIPIANGDRGDRRTSCIDPAVIALRSGVFHYNGRLGPTVMEPVWIFSE